MLSLIHQATRNFAMEEQAEEVLKLLEAFRVQWKKYVEKIEKYILRKHLTKFIIVKIHLQKHTVFIENIWNLKNLSISVYTGAQQQ